MSYTAARLCEDLFLFMGRIKHELLVLAEEHDLTVMQFFALFAINREGQLAMGRVAEVLHCDASNVTGIVDRLVQRNLVVRCEAAHDRRTKTLQLTAKGKAVVDELMQAVPERVVCGVLSSAEQDTLHILVRKVSAPRV